MEPLFMRLWWLDEAIQDLVDRNILQGGITLFRIKRFIISTYYAKNKITYSTLFTVFFHSCSSLRSTFFLV